jgi:hypothetical protein
MLPKETREQIAKHIRSRPQECVTIDGILIHALPTNPKVGYVCFCGQVPYKEMNDCDPPSTSS